MVVPATARSSLGQLDELLSEVCVVLQIPHSMYEDAKGKYEAVGKWLVGEGSPLHGADISIYAQGSVAIQTTVRPRRNENEEFDVDLVFEVRLPGLEPLQLYGWVLDRLRSNGTYAPLVEPLKRCIRLNYAGKFHLDVLPAVPDPQNGGTCILVPDRKDPRRWSPSNPRGFMSWFNDRAGRYFVEAEKRGTEPLPQNVPSESRPPLKRAVQLMKRRRDVAFNRSDHAPRSVVLTTLAGEHYAGEQDVVSALVAVLDRVHDQIETSRGPLLIRNPANADELFSEAWQADRVSYDRFTRFIQDFRDEMRALQTASGLGSVGKLLGAMFGESPTSEAMKRATARVEDARRSGSLRVGRGGRLTSAAGVVVPRNTFFGE